MRTKAKWIFVFATLIAVVFVALELAVGNINYKYTLFTSYNSSQKKGWQLVETSWGNIATPKGWFHFSSYPTCPGYVGSFLTINGIVHYEYGMFAPSFESRYSNGFIVTKDSIGGYKLNIIKNENEAGFYIPPQGNMEWGLTIYPTNQIAENLEEFKEALTNIEFKR